jgi:hypothetical protein
MLNVAAIIGSGVFWGWLGFMWIEACRLRGWGGFAQASGVVTTMVMAALSTVTLLVILA